MELIGTPDNPVPPGALISAVGAEDGALLRIARWSPEPQSPGQRSLGTVCVFTGRGEFIEKYFETIGELVESTRRASGIEINLDQSWPCATCVGENIGVLHRIAQEALANALRHAQAHVQRLRQ